MAPGFRLGKKAAELVPPPTDLQDGLQSLRRALERYRTEPRRVPNPAIGPLTNAEWDQLHCRHAELHLSFLVPVT